MKTMRYRLLTIVCSRMLLHQGALLMYGSLLSVVTSFAQPRFVPDTDIKKVGEVEFQVPRQFSLGFTNKGDKPLIIKEVKASCGCLDVSFPKTPIAAGARGEITLTFDAKLLSSFYKEVEVMTDYHIRGWY